MGLDYNASKKIALKIIIVLAIITVVEVFIALVGKGYVIDGLHFNKYVMILIMTGLSLLKAILILREFMHLKYEVPVLEYSIYLPMILLLWGMIAFLIEGDAWKDARFQDEEIEVVEPETEIGFLKKENIENIAFI